MRINLFFLAATICCSVPIYSQGNIEIFGGYSAQSVDTERFEEFSRYAGMTPPQVQSNFGASATQLDSAFKDTYRAARNLNGVNASLTYYFAGKLGITGDFGFHFRKEKRETRNNPVFFEDFTRSRGRSFTFAGGPQYKFSRTSRIQPFVRALVGVVRQENRSSQFFNDPGGTNPGGTDQPIETTRLIDDFTALTAGVGGGLDVRVRKNISLRLVQVDYLATFARSRDASFTSPATGGGNGVSLGPTSFDNSKRNTMRFSFGIVFRK